ncbi:MAG TPA: STAS domain-containing protein [Methylomirabilota bacterium]|jgi:anti-anti-sigma factor|nr:STAS domain-containing protein [Methylomirabilota bacterium]
MDVTFDRLEDCLVVRLRGRLDRLTSGPFEQTLQREMTPPAVSVAFDCRHLEYVSSAGLRVVLATAKALRPAGHSVVLFGMQPMVREVFDISGFSEFLAILLDEPAALAAVRAPGRGLPG